MQRVVAAPPHAVWELLVDLDTWPQWGPSVKQARLDPPFDELTAHATGVVDTVLGVSVPFVVSDFDPGRYWAWRVAGIPATWHRVDPIADGARVTIGVPWWEVPYLTVCSLGLRRIEKLLLRPA
ncbi:SRPBCC family protein [Mycobacterium spongiae]|uniref:SRPBCC family protein n=1 Tax=Mycobacterium spongiae TaxID=886343 RepID=UPI001FE8F93A|nr:SRPBCC family protein [Mycobacterium spongiae]